jgi:hypothetical protein
VSIISDQVDKVSGRYVKDSASVLLPDKEKDTKSPYMPTADELLVRNSILKDFRNGWQTMHTSRPEFNDLSLYQRHITDMLAFNTYQENDGNPAMEDRLGGWRSQAMRPIQRNKAISIAAHETARLTVPKIFAYDEDSDEQEDSAKVMAYLVDWAREQANYTHEALFRVIASLYSPLSWGFTEYGEVYRDVYEDDKLTSVLDEDYSGHRHIPLATDQVFFPNFYERDPQKQDFLLIRRIISYDNARGKYGRMKNFEHVTSGIQVVMDDANNGFYQVYDPHMRQDDVEEVLRWRKRGNSYEVDSKHIMVNGVLLSPAISPNPRIDHQYPLDCFYYLPINEKCIAGKSLVFAMGPESALLNTQYQMINDGNFLNLFPPTITTGSDKVGMDVIVPGLNTAFADKDVQINPLRTATDQSLNTAMKVMEQVEASLNASSQDPVQQGQNPGTPSTAYEISRIEQNAATVLGLSMKFIAQHAINYGKLLVSDILQYQTIADAQKITGNNGLIYKTFYAKEPGETGKMNKVKFDLNLPDSMTEDQKEEMSFAILEEQGGIKSDMRLWKVNPVKFREFKYMFTVDSDVLNPRSADLSRAMDLETYDRAIANPMADQTKIFTDLLMATNPKTARDPDKYVQQAPPPSANPVPPQGQQDATGNTISPLQQNKPVPSTTGTLQ